MIVGRGRGNKRVAITGCWRLAAAENGEGDLDAQINELFTQMSSDLNVWRDLAAQYCIEAFCRVFMKTCNDGLVLNATTLQLLAEHVASPDLDIYDAEDR